MRIDCQSHLFPRAYAEALTSNPGYPRAARTGAAYRIDYWSFQSFHLDPEIYAINRVLEHMDAERIDLSVVSVNMPGPEALEPELGIRAARICNEYLAEVVMQHPDRFRGLACLPWQDPPSALLELDRAVHELGLVGVMFYARAGDIEVDAPVLDPVYARVEELGIPVVLHPTVPPWGATMSDHSMITMVGLMVEQSTAALRLILGGVLERFARLKVVQPHCGGVLPYLWGRVENQTEVMGRGREHISRPVGEYYDRVYLDTVSPSLPALRLAWEFAGADRLLFGSDHPWVDIGVFTELLEALDIPQDAKEKIWSGNARELFGI